MTASVVTVSPETDFKACARRLQQHNVSALPVVDREHRLIGIVSEADLLAKERERGARKPALGIRWDGSNIAAGRTAAEIMTSPAISIAPNASVAEAARLMYREAVKRLPVVDSHGAVIGIVSRADLVKTFLRSDDSIRRDIVEDVAKKSLFIDPKTLRVEVVDGLVKLSGKLESKSLCQMLVRMVERVEGTVGVDSKLTWALDDTRLRVEQPPQALQLTADQRA